MSDETTTIPEEELPDKTKDVEAYIDSLVAGLESTQDIGEAGGVAWADIYGTARDGHQVKVSLTSRARTPDGALVNLMKAIKVADVKFHMHPWLPDSHPVSKPASTPAPAATKPTPASVPTPPAAKTPPPAAKAPPKADDAVEEEIVDVTVITHQITTSGKHCLNVKGGRFTAHGVPAWPEAIPPEADGWEDWPVGTGYGPLESMKKAAFEMKDGKPKKVLRFIA